MSEAAFREARCNERVRDVDGVGRSSKCWNDDEMDEREPKEVCDWLNATATGQPLCTEIQNLLVSYGHRLGHPSRMVPAFVRICCCFSFASLREITWCANSTVVSERVSHALSTGDVAFAQLHAHR